MQRKSGKSWPGFDFMREHWWVWAAGLTRQLVCKVWENYKLIFFCGYMFVLHKKSIVFCASCGCYLTTMLYTKEAGGKTHEIYVWDIKRRLPFWNLCIKLKDCTANPHQSETINTSLNTEACKILRAERKSCCLWHFQGRKNKPSLSEQ